ncbi:MAG: hypothetical protein KatS3mg032_0144 [Cyclobacteriaceae bacterium]|nr:MAG: hypothetical protein KatS3mg032_0144 [Cyclobacteriaceae bacterium]
MLGPGHTSPADHRPPVFSNWRGWYLLLLVWLAAQLMFYYFLTSLFA